MTTIQSALGDGTETAYFQPIVYPSGGIAGYEALGRYVRDDEVVPPGEFLPKLEACGLMPEFDRRTASLAIRQLKAWRKEGEHLTMSVNASPQALADSSYAAHLIGEAFRANVSPRHITVEILENCQFYKEEAYMESLQRLGAAGFRLAVDDFPECENPEGLITWLSFRELKLHTLKIDRSLVRNIMSYETQLQLARYVGVARDYGMKVVAEGVETKAQLSILHNLGVDLLQGFYFGKPQPAEHAYHLARHEERRMHSMFNPALVPA